ncbi:hypothetical protein R1flu_022858 [Riccia fluitans]|uniref:Uncharacterized protein n=1 Tax=Riccia fluitans TaxID=41844 RepID=A0ABD1XQG2_9MARC
MCLLSTFLPFVFNSIRDYFSFLFVRDAFSFQIDRPSRKPALLLILALIVQKDNMYSAVGRTALAAVSGGAALLGFAFLSSNTSSVSPSISAPTMSAAPVVTVPDVRAAEVLEPHCDCGPLWECMQKELGSCGLLDKQLRDCLARNKR